MTVGRAAFPSNGLVCITDSTITPSCPSSPPRIGPITSSNVTVDVFIQGSSPVGGFDIYVRSDTAYLVPVSASLGTLIASPTFTSICVNDQSVNGSCTPNTANGPGVVEVSTIESSGNNDPGTGLAFTITYRAVHSTANTTLSYPSGPGCSPSSLEGSTCVAVVDSVGNILPEESQTANVNITHFVDKDQPPIIIDGNRGFTLQNGVRSGNGTASDPYAIDDWNIVPPGGITIENTDAYFVIRNVYVHSAGVRIMNVTNGLVQSSGIGTHMTIDSSRSILLDQSYVYGITIDSSRNITVYRSYVYDITINSSNNLTIFGSGGSYNRVIISSSENSTLLENRLYEIDIHESTRIAFLRNTFSTLNIYNSTWLTVENNTLTGGISIRDVSSEQLDSDTISTDNRVGGGSLLFYKNCSGVKIDSIESGELIVANCSGVQISNVRIAGLVETVLVRDAVVNNVTSSVLIASSRMITVANVQGGVELESASDVQISHVGDVSISRSANVSISETGSADVSYSKNVSILDSGNGPFERFTSSISASDNVTVKGNAFCYGDCTGLSILGSSHITVSDNSFNGDEGLDVEGSSFLQISDNLIYGVTGALNLDSCSHVSIMGNQFPSGGDEYPGVVRISRCNGIQISGNTLAAPTLLSCALYNCSPRVDIFVKIYYSSNMVIEGNTITNSSTAINIADSSNATIRDNTLQTDLNGVVLNDTSNFRLFHNNFLNNTFPVVDAYSTGNVWDSGYPSGGNYWSNSSRIDNCSGTQQNICTGPDGIVDAPYFFSNGEDRYPLAKPYSSYIVGTMSLKPSTISLQSPPRYLKVSILLQPGFNASNLGLSSIRLNDTRSPDPQSLARVQTSGGISHLMITFDMVQVESIMPRPGNYVLQVTANIVTQTQFRPFVAYSAIRAMT